MTRFDSGRSRDRRSTESGPELGGDRLDKWLWHVRLVKTRIAAAELVSAGHVRVNGQRIAKPGYGVKPGDVIVVVRRNDVRTLKVVTFAARRGDTASATLLYEDLTPPAPVTSKSQADAPSDGALGDRSVPTRAPGAGRPTKRDRRQIDRMRSRST